MIIIETCPKCGHDLTDLVLTVNPPIPQKKCFNCGWNWTGKQEEVVRVPFGGNSLNAVNEDYTLDNLLNVTNLTIDNNLDNITIENFSQSACENCPSNPKNGGSGICHCTLGQIQVAY